MPVPAAMLAAETLSWPAEIDAPESETTNVGPALSSFVGREADLAALRGLLGFARLVTITGPAGAGKTRLALELVRQDPPIDERWFCDLSEVRSGEGLAAAVARAIGASLGPGQSEEDDIQRVGRALATRGPVLLILDRFEHIRCLAQVVQSWSDKAPETRFIVTSRAPLALAGEHLIPIRGLALADEAVRLFIDRARMVRHGYEPTPGEMADIAEIVARLDGLPLAIELAASRVRVLGPRQIADHLSQRFALLRGEGPTTLRHTIEWSWQLLAPHEQRALTQASVFHGGFDLAAAEAVLDHGEGDLWVLDVVQSLADHSLLQVYQAREGELRYRLYESVRAFAAEMLEQSDEAGARHRVHFVRRANMLRRLAEGREAARALGDLELDRDNLLAVHRAAVARGDGGAALEIALALAPLLLARGPLTSLAALLDDAIGVAPSHDPRVIEALLARSDLADERGRLREGLSDRKRALSLATELGDRRLEGRVLASLGRHAWRGGRLDRSAEHYEQALDLQRQTGDRAQEGRTLAWLADVRYLQGDAAAARLDYDQALDLLRRDGDPSSEALALGNLGCLEHDCGHHQRARRRLEEALVILRNLGSRHAEGHVLTQLGVVALAERDVVGARERFERALRLRREMGNLRQEGVVLAYLGQCEELDGDRDASRRSYEQAIGLLHDHGHPLLEGLARAWRGRLEADVDEIGLAGRFLADSQRILESVGRTIVSTVPAICGAHLDLALARASEAGGDLERARRLRDTARAVAESVRKEGAARSSGDVREALARLGEALREADTLPSLSPPSLRGSEPIVPSDEALVISESGRAFCPPGGEPVDLSTRAAPRRILKALAEHRERHPGHALAVEALLEAGWPGERLLAEAGKTRVYTAVATLRRKGLKAHLLRVDEGYLLDPALPLSRG